MKSNPHIETHIQSAICTHTNSPRFVMFCQFTFMSQRIGKQHEAVKTTIEKVLIPSNKARIPVHDERRAAKKLEELTLVNIKKNKNRQTVTQKQNEEAFTAMLLR